MPTHELIPLDRSYADELHTLINRCWTADQIGAVLSRPEVDEMLEAPHFDPAFDARVAILDGRLVGFTRVIHRPSEEREERSFLDGGVDPDHRGQAIGRDLVRWGLDRSIERLAARPNDLPRHIRAEVYETQPDKLALFTRFGFSPARYFEEMLRPLANLPSFHANGIQIQAWDLSRSKEIRRVQNEAFQDQWGIPPADEATWDRWETEYGSRLDLSFVAVDEGSIVGFALNGHYPEDERVHGRREGWIESLGTLREHRRRGVGTALITRSMQAFADAGLTHAALGVDSANPSGAHQLYRRLGFVTDRRSVLVQRKLPG